MSAIVPSQCLGSSETRVWKVNWVRSRFDTCIGLVLFEVGMLCYGYDGWTRICMLQWCCIHTVHRLLARSHVVRLVMFRRLSCSAVCCCALRIRPIVLSSSIFRLVLYSTIPLLPLLPAPQLTTTIFILCRFASHTFRPPDGNCHLLSRKCTAPNSSNFQTDRLLRNT